MSSSVLRIAPSSCIWIVLTVWVDLVLESPPPPEAITAAPAPPASAADATRISRRERSFAMRGREASLSGDGDLTGRLGRDGRARSRRRAERVLRVRPADRRPRRPGLPREEPPRVAVWLR